MFLKFYSCGGLVGLTSQPLGHPDSLLSLNTHFPYYFEIINSQPLGQPEALLVGIL